FTLLSSTHTFATTFFFFNDTPPTEIYTLSLHDALPILGRNGQHDEGSAEARPPGVVGRRRRDGECAHRRERRPRVGRGRPQRDEIGRDTSELQSRFDLVCRLLLEKKKK